MPRRVPVERWAGGERKAEDDWLAEEAPLEILIEHSFKDQRRTASWGITLRSPGHDEELALGLLFSEGRVESAADVEMVDCLEEGRVRVALAPHVDLDLGRQRAATAACGFCGSPDLPVTPALEDRGFRMTYEVLSMLPALLESKQGHFQETGAVHAAALFNSVGTLVAVREDVGRHNAVDKLIGWAFGQKLLPLEQAGLLLSGRAGFELVHKAARAGIPFVAAIGAPTTLSVDLARHTNVTLAGFLRPGKVNLYSGTWRLR
ncbi:MAG: formate dehydrogenase accessory sulfurtransferase FdhD [Acidobacteria bacterium]|nr:formate dehydrogenase accessory sulfurtransferase FdhD [Acidobacteriota bacterium]